MNRPQFEQLKVSCIKYAILTLFLFVMRAFIAHPIIIIASWISAVICVAYFIAMLIVYYYG
ncbi:hypothetical protein LG542_03985 [Latilactobacillus graminis]|uniref:Uncharacterized protein n=1 Tax=Latilactobacillus graminis TaxID=60519 RepID=A0ABX6CAP4_9LACO|nr:hypothetical protein LG542_03985 [Latilactobacillus graminis]